MADGPSAHIPPPGSGSRVPAPGRLSRGQRRALVLSAVALLALMSGGVQLLVGLAMALGGLLLLALVFVIGFLRRPLAQVTVFDALVVGAIVRRRARRASARWPGPW